MNQPPMMAGMNAAGGPVGGVPVSSAAMAANAAHNPGVQQPGQDSRDPTTLLNTYIYDYFLRSGQYELARLLKNKVDIIIDDETTKSLLQGNANGVSTDRKDDVKRPTDLPAPNIISSDQDTPFILEWWSQFWDIFSAHRGKDRANPATISYLAHEREQSRARHQNHRMMTQMDPTMYRMGMMSQNGNMIDLQKRAMANSRSTPNLHQVQLKMQQMGRDGNAMVMDGQRPQSPGSMDSAPSPKRQRTDGNGFNGPAMGPMGRGQGMPGQPGQGGPGNQMIMGQNGMPGMTSEQFQQIQNNPHLQKQMEGMTPGGVPQGVSMAQQGEGGIGEVFSGRMATTQAGTPNGNHALQDYQMQLMLLEQQNKRRLLMARQEQDNMTHGPGGPGPMPPNQAQFGPGMSPGQRPGPSPNPNDQMKRGTPKMGVQNLPGSPMPDGSMPPNRNSPSGSFDPGQLPSGIPQPQYMHMPQQMNGGLRPPSSHPFSQAMSPQQMEALRQRMPNGPMWQNGPPQQLMQPGQQQPPQQQQPGGQPPQQPGPMGAPQQRNGRMPPPPAPQPEQTRPGQQTSSPSQNSNAPPTPSQAPKAVPKGKKEANAGSKKKPSKKGSTANAGATPASESQEPPTPTPSTPITPRHANSFQPNGTQNAQAGTQAPNAGQNAPNQNSGAPQMDGAQQQPGFEGQDGNLGGTMGQDGVNLEFAIAGEDVLGQFDFDSFLQPDDDGTDFNFDGGFNIDMNGVEAGDAI